jgi:hypothetical protein
MIKQATPVPGIFKKQMKPHFLGIWPFFGHLAESHSLI